MSSNRSKTTGSIVAYKVAMGHGPNELTQYVRQLMDEGWKVHGYPSVSFNPMKEEVIMIQAMVRYSEPDSGGSK